MLKIVLDTNIILSSVATKSPYHLILQSLFKKKFELYVTNEILLEYEEKLQSNFNVSTATNLIGAILLMDNVKRIQTFFDLDLIKIDVDDNKFVNCAFASNVHFIVSNDKHFKILQNIDFPKLNVISIDQFMEMFID